MKAKFGFKRIGLTAIAAALALSVSVGSAMAYFTASDASKGQMTLHMADTTTEITETFSNWTKHLVATNTGDTPCYIRVTAQGPTKYSLTYSGSGWTDGGDGYWYYGEVVQPGESAPTIDVAINGVSDEDRESFNVVVIEEACPVLYQEDGTPYADWNQTVKNVDNYTGGED